MLTPSQYIAKAIVGVRERLMPESISTMESGDSVARVTRIGTPARGEDEISGDGPAEAVRVLALAADFPHLAKEDAARLDGALHIVTSVRTDPTETSMTVGLSTALNRYAAEVRGRRAGRDVIVPVDILAKDDGPQTDFTDTYGEVEAHVWTVAIPRESWSETNDPQVGDEIRMDETRLKVAKVDERGGYFIIQARSKR